jgi:methylase of polypeptide subunit release factors
MTMVLPSLSLAASSAACCPPDAGAGEALSGADLLTWRRRLLELGGHRSDLDWLLDLAGGLRWSVLQRLRLEPHTEIQLLLSRQELEAIWCRHLQKAEPLQYLVGICPWRDLELRVAPGVLIPRQESELLVDLALTSLSAECRGIELAPCLADGEIDPGASAGEDRPGGLTGSDSLHSFSPADTWQAGSASRNGHDWIRTSEISQASTAGRDRHPGALDRDRPSALLAPHGEAAQTAQPSGLSAGLPEPSGLLWADLGTGSGCLALALARALPGARGLAADRSEQALAQAAHNLHRYGLEERVRLCCGDWWEALEPWWGQLDLVVANPPYIPSAVIEGLDPVVRDHEPRLALDGGGDGLEAIRAIAAGARRALAPGGVLLLEHHHDQSAAVLALLAQAGLVAVSAHRDLEGTERFARASRSRHHG